MAPLPGMEYRPTLWTYVAVFSGSALACFVAAYRLRTLEDRDTRRGLLALLLAGGGWAGTHVGFLLAPTPRLKVAFYVAGLVVGLATVGPWLYFCSAYTGRTVHRHGTVRKVAVAVFLGVVLVKITNPFHGLYFRTELVGEPFVHLAVQGQPLHWIVMGLSYALSSVGYFVLFEQFLQSGQDARPLMVLTAVTGLPVVLDVVGLATPLLVDIPYEPIGVAAFALGVAFVYTTRFRTGQVAGGYDDPVVVLDADDRIRDYNRCAQELFPALATGDPVGEPFASVLPAVAGATDDDPPVVDVDNGGERRHYRVTVNAFAPGRAHLGRLVTLSDVTDSERYRRELERQNERLERFANVVAHDLRNPLEVANGGVELARSEGDSANLDEIDHALGRMEAIIDDVLALARQGKSIDETEPVALSTTAEQSWRVIDANGATLSVESDLVFRADPDRVRQLLENLFRNNVEHGGSGVTVRVGPTDRRDGFYVADDGTVIPVDERATVFEPGYSTAEQGTGFGLSIVKEIADAHGWTVVVTGSADGGTRIEVVGVERVEAPH